MKLAVACEMIKKGDNKKIGIDIKNIFKTIEDIHYSIPMKLGDSISLEEIFVLIGKTQTKKILLEDLEKKLNEGLNSICPVRIYEIQLLLTNCEEQMKILRKIIYLLATNQEEK